jgi:hypothetical protein
VKADIEYELLPETELASSENAAPLWPRDFTWGVSQKRTPKASFYRYANLIKAARQGEREATHAA